jgi:predicted nucleic-acid-binding protein
VRAVDTNILVRFLTGDEPQQSRVTRRILAEGNIFIGTTVLLETEWVLRSGYGLKPAAIVSSLRGLGGLPGISMEEPAVTAQALDWMLDGMDFADALHLARSRHCSSFLTFDKRLAAASKAKSAVSVKTL